MDILGKLIQERTEAAAYEVAMKDLAATYSTRAKRMNARQNAISVTIGQLLDAMGETKVKHPMATVSRTKARWSVRIDDELEVPSQLKYVTTKPDRCGNSKAQMDEGETVPGCSINPGNPSITVRIK